MSTLTSPLIRKDSESNSDIREPKPVAVAWFAQLVINGVLFQNGAWIPITKDQYESEEFKDCAKKVHYEIPTDILSTISKLEKERDYYKAQYELATDSSKNSESQRAVWPNWCDKTVPDALRYLAENDRPSGGNDKYNSEHLHQLADEVESFASKKLYLSSNISSTDLSIIAELKEKINKLMAPRLKVNHSPICDAVDMYSPSVTCNCGADQKSEDNNTLPLYTELESKVRELASEISQRNAVLSLAKKVLKELEWSEWQYDKGGEGYASCPSCSSVQYGTNCTHQKVGHAKDCELNSLLEVISKMEKLNE